jgi:hypothetical protein
MQNIIAAMKKRGVRRLIITSTLSAKDPNDPLNFKTKVMVSLVKVTMHNALGYTTKWISSSEAFPISIESIMLFTSTQL